MRKYKYHIAFSKKLSSLSQEEGCWLATDTSLDKEVFFDSPDKAWENLYNLEDFVCLLRIKRSNYFNKIVFVEYIEFFDGKWRLLRNVNVEDKLYDFSKFLSKKFREEFRQVFCLNSFYHEESFINWICKILIF